jgi:hypothetical protein
MSDDPLKEIMEDDDVTYAESPGFWCEKCNRNKEVGVPTLMVVHKNWEDCPYAGKCYICLKRDATVAFGDSLFHTHFSHKNACEYCVTEKQLEHARERAAALPELERKMQELKDGEAK